MMPPRAGGYPGPLASPSLTDPTSSADERIPEDLERQLDLSERRRHLHALHGARTRSSISRAIAIPSATACSFDFSFAARMRVDDRLAAPTRPAPRSRETRRCARDTSGQMPAMIGMRTCSIVAEERLELRDVEHRLRDRVLGARLHLPLEALELVRRIDRRRDSRRRRSRTASAAPIALPPGSRP